MKMDGCLDGQMERFFPGSTYHSLSKIVDHGYKSESKVDRIKDKCPSRATKDWPQQISVSVTNVQINKQTSPNHFHFANTETQLSSLSKLFALLNATKVDTR